MRLASRLVGRVKPVRKKSETIVVVPLASSTVYQELVQEKPVYQKVLCFKLATEAEMTSTSGATAAAVVPLHSTATEAATTNLLDLPHELRRYILEYIFGDALGVLNGVSYERPTLLHGDLSIIDASQMFRKESLPILFRSAQLHGQCLAQETFYQSHVCGLEKVRFARIKLTDMALLPSGSICAGARKFPALKQVFIHVNHNGKQSVTDGDYSSGQVDWIKSNIHQSIGGVITELRCLLTEPRAFGLNIDFQFLRHYIVVFHAVVTRNKLLVLDGSTIMREGTWVDELCCKLNLSRYKTLDGRAYEKTNQGIWRRVEPG